VKVSELLRCSHISELVSCRNQHTFAFIHDLFRSWKCDRWFHVHLKEGESDKRRNRRERRAKAIPRESPWFIEVDGWRSKALGNANSESGKKHCSNTFFLFFSLPILVLLGHYFPVQETDSKMGKIYVSGMTRWLFVSSQNLSIYMVFERLHMLQ